MLEILKNHRLSSLRDQYKNVMKEAGKFMKAGNLRDYVHKLTEASKIRREYAETLTLQV